ncbi:MAG: hypothetical protein RBT66_09890 [bacterium]|jgi:hypothetical protein|nr:hypothetical protein [bacterium]
MVNDKYKRVILTGVKTLEAAERSGRIPAIAPGCIMEEVGKLGTWEVQSAE